MADMVDDVHTILDELIVNYPGQFPDGPDFLEGVEKCLKRVESEGYEWSIHPMSSDGYKIVLTNGTETHTILRNEDGGKI